MALSPAYYAHCAGEARALARRTRDPELSRLLLEVAAAYAELVDPHNRRDRNLDYPRSRGGSAVGRTPTPVRLTPAAELARDRTAYAPR
jgi:hypothetical protein